MSAPDLDGAAMRALHALCGAQHAARITWGRYGVTLRVTTRDGAAQRFAVEVTAADLAAAVCDAADVMCRDALTEHLRALRATAPTLPPPASDNTDRMEMDR